MVGRTYRVKVALLIVVIVTLFFSTHNLKGQQKRVELGLDYVTEFQANFRGDYNWVNLLGLRGEYKAWQGGSFVLESNSTYKTRSQRILDDLQTFSNIEEKNMLVNIMMAGYEHRFRAFSLYFGIRNMNEDYFIGDYTSLFTNSVCGIYPTLAENFEIANYPRSAMTLHTQIELTERWSIKGSLYNGVARIISTSGASLFSISPSRDGVLALGELAYSSEKRGHRLYTLGAVYHSGVRSGRESVAHGAQSRYSVWAGVEQSLYSAGEQEIGLLLQGSFAPKGRSYSRNFVGGGLLLSGFILPQRNDQIGVYANLAQFSHSNEVAMELTWQCTLNRYIALQPALHCIITGSKTRTAGVLRLYFTL